MHTTWPITSETYEVVLSAVIFNTSLFFIHYQTAKINRKAFLDDN